jgi:hypothetical protein
VLVALPSASPVLVLGLPSRRIGAIALAASGLRKSVTMFYRCLMAEGSFSPWRAA